MIAVRFEKRVPGLPQEWVSSTFDGERWTLIGLMGTGPADPFNELPDFTDFAAEDQQELLNMIWQQRGKRKHNRFKAPPVEFLAESNLNSGPVSKERSLLSRCLEWVGSQSRT